MVKIIKTYYSFLLLLSKILYNNLRNIGRYIVILSCLTVYLSPYLVEAQPKSFTTESNLTPSQNIPSFFLKVVNHDSLSRADDTLGYENRFGIGQTFNSSLYDFIEINTKNQQLQQQIHNLQQQVAEKKQ